MTMSINSATVTTIKNSYDISEICHDDSNKFMFKICKVFVLKVLKIIYLGKLSGTHLLVLLPINN